MFYEYIAAVIAVRKQKKAIKYVKKLIDMYDDRDMVDDVKALKRVLHDQELVFIYLQLEKEQIRYGQKK